MTIKQFSDKFSIPLMIIGFMLIAIGGITGVVNPIWSNYTNIVIAIGVLSYIIGRVTIIISKRNNK